MGEERSSTRPLAGAHFHVLLALSDEARYGVAIAEEVAEQTGGAVRLGPGTLYTAIKKLLQDGLIEEWTPPHAGDDDPRRRYYRITGSGRAALTAEANHLEGLLAAARLKRVLP